MLPEVDTLPRAEREPPADDGNGQARLRQRSPHVGRHVVSPLSRVRPERVSLRHQPTEERLQVVPHVRICVLLHHEARGRVLDKDRAQPLGDTGRLDCVDHLSGDLDEALPSGRDTEQCCHPAHGRIWTSLPLAGANGGNAWESNPPSPSLGRTPQVLKTRPNTSSDALPCGNGSICCDRVRVKGTSGRLACAARGITQRRDRRPPPPFGAGCRASPFWTSPSQAT